MEKKDYKDVFVFVEQRAGKIQNVALELLGKARELADSLGEKVVAVLAGHNVSGLASTLIAHGADKVVIADYPELEHYITEPYAQTVSKVIDNYKPGIMLFGATTIGRDLGPRLSARVGTGLTADCTGLAISEEGDLMMTRPAFGGNLMATIVCKEHRPQMSTVRPGVMKALEPDECRKGVVENIDVDFDRSRFHVRVKERINKDNDSVDISDAKVLVSGGRGVGTGDGLTMLRKLADTLGGEVSASRAVVDAGLIDHDRQVGQTGKTVRPNVYLALGISGAIQHLAGMEESECIIAVNKDKFAPIFSVADLGIVGDLKKIVPKLTEALSKEKK